jgi:hypothetical protein
MPRVTLTKDAENDGDGVFSMEDRRKSTLLSGGFLIRIVLPKNSSVFTLKSPNCEDAYQWFELFCSTRNKAIAMNNSKSGSLLLLLFFIIHN